MVRVHPFSKYAKFTEKLKCLTPRYTHVRVRIRGNNVSFSENFAYVLNGWSLRKRNQYKNSKVFHLETLFWHLIVVSYDESLNTILEEDQIDTLVTFFIETTELVEIRYFDSTFSNVSVVLIVYRSLSNLSHLCFIQMYCSCQWMVLMSIQMS